MDYKIEFYKALIEIIGYVKESFSDKPKILSVIETIEIIINNDITYPFHYFKDNGYKELKHVVNMPSSAIKISILIPDVIRDDFIEISKIKDLTIIDRLWFNPRLDPYREKIFHKFKYL